MAIVPWRVLALLCRFGRRMHIVAPQSVVVEDDFEDADRILDLGGGGEGVIGQLRGRQVTAVDIRQGELDDAPAGPVKVVADARALPFADRSFDAATAFFFLMYVANVDRRTVLQEAFRSLVPGGRLRVWDAAIPAPGERAARTFVVPVCAKLPERTVRTAYGVPWKGREMTGESIAALLRETGFAVTSLNEDDKTFHLVAVKPIPA